MLSNLAALLAQQPTFPDFPSTGGPKTEPGGLAELFGGGMCCCGCAGAFLLLFLPMIIGMWKIFVKAGQPGWAALVPIYNYIVAMQLIGKPWWWWLMYNIPFYGWYLAIVDMLTLVRCFGKDVGFLIGMILLPYVFIPILGFGSAQYSPPAGTGMGGGGGFAPPPGPRPGGPRPGGPQGGIRPGGPGGAPPRR